MVRFDNSRGSGDSRATAYCAILLMLGGLLSACSVWDAGTAALPGASDTSTSPAPDSVDPWTLPIEERPELFNPCTEISLHDLTAAGLENPTPRPEAEDSSENPPLHQCGWNTDNFTVIIGAHWTRLEDLGNRAVETIEFREDFHGHAAAHVRSLASGEGSPCGLSTETTSGLISVDLIPRADFTSDPAFTAFESTCSWADSISEGLATSLPLEDS